MLNNLKKGLYFFKMQLLFTKGIKEGKIIPFDDEFYEKMNHTFFNSIPISMHIRYLKPTDSLGKCYDRSLYMFFCFDDALLVRADNKNLELSFGKENAGHGWIEIDDYVYDPSLMMRFDRDLYYKIYVPTNVNKFTKEDYQKLNGSCYADVINTRISDFQPGGNKRADLCIIIPLIKEMVEYTSDGQFKKELDEYLSLIQYDNQQVYKELIHKCNLDC